jgi:hypothetical protein
MQGGDESDEDADSESSDSDDSDADGAGDSGGTSSGGSVGGAGESCNAVLTCMLDCPDDACGNACYANGSDGARQKIDALLGCLNASMCADAECAKMACAPEIDACVQDADVPVDSGPPVTQGVVPAELVGDWINHRGSYHFDAGGSYWFVGVLDSDGPCIGFDKIVYTHTGLASANGDGLTLTAQTVQKETTDCSGQVTTEMNPGHTSQYTWSIVGSTLTLVGESGAIEYTKQ